MNKKILCIFLLATFATKAQIKEKNDIEVSAILGLASSDYYGHESSNEFDPFLSPTFGINADYYTSNRWSFRLGIEYRTFGAQIELFDWFSNKVLDQKEKLNYVFVPIHANWHFGKNRNWNLNFGPSLSFLESVKINDFKKSKDNLSNFQVGLGFGIGYKFVLSEKFNLAIEYQEYISFMNSFKKRDYNVYYGNIGGSFNVRFIYNLNSKKVNKE